MRIVPIPDNVVLDDNHSRGSLGPPRGMSGRDVDTIDVIWSEVKLPSGEHTSAVQALVFVPADELADIQANGGYFWVRFLGQSFPPVSFFPPAIHGDAEASA